MKCFVNNKMKYSLKSKMYIDRFMKVRIKYSGGKK